MSSSRFSVAKGVCLFRPAGSTSRPYYARTYFSRFAGGSPSAAAAAPAAGGGRFCVQVARLHTDRDAKLSSPHPPAAQIQSPTPNDAFCCGCAAAAAADSAGCACSHPCPVGWGWVGLGGVGLLGGGRLGACVLRRNGAELGSVSWSEHLSTRACTAACHSHTSVVGVQSAAMTRDNQTCGRLKCSIISNYKNHVSRAFQTMHA